MEIIVGGLVIGLVLAAGYGFVTFVMTLHGIPTERRKTREAREALAVEIQASDERAEAERQLRVEGIKAQLREREAERKQR